MCKTVISLYNDRVIREMALLQETGETNFVYQEGWKWGRQAKTSLLSQSYLISEAESCPLMRSIGYFI